MAKLDLQKFLEKAGEAGIVNLDLTIGQMVKSEAFGMLQLLDEPWEDFCGNDFRFQFWPGPRKFEEVAFGQQLASALRESLQIATELKQTLSSGKA